MHTELPEEYLAPAWSWYTKWCNPVIANMYMGERQTVSKLLAAAWTALSASDLDADRHQCAYYRLCYVAWQEPLRMGSAIEAGEAYLQLLDRLAASPEGVLSAAMRQRMLLQTRCQADLEGLALCTPEEYQALRAGLPQYLRDAELYHFLAGWAFKHRQLTTLEEALEIMTFSPTGYQSDFAWQRVNLMYLLLERRATRRDVLELIKRMSFRHHWRVVQTSLWEAVNAAGLVDAQVQSALAAKLEVLNTQLPKAPGQGQSTVRIRKDL